MAVFLDANAADFEAEFVALLNAKRESSADVDDAVAAIIADVRARGDAALAEYSLRFDRVDLARQGIRISAAEIDAAVAASDPKAVEALRIRARAHPRLPPPAGAAATSPSSMRSASSSAGAGGRSSRSGSMCPAARRAIPPRC